MDSVQIREVGLRDGLQSISTVLPTDKKKRWIDLAYEAGIRRFEVGSLLPAGRLPQLDDSVEVAQYALRLEETEISVLVPNFKGGIRALELGVHTMIVPLSASIKHSWSNLGKGPKAVADEVARLVKERDQGRFQTRIEGGVGTAFGCTLQGQVLQADVISLLRQLEENGVDTLSIADTVGCATPSEVKNLLNEAQRKLSRPISGVHFHNTRGMAVANAWAAFEQGIRSFDSSLGGIGGCPYAPGASGNVATEELVYLFHQKGLSNINLSKLLDLYGALKEWFPNQTFHSALGVAGLMTTEKGGA